MLNLEQASVLKCEERGESSVYLVLFCPECGVIDAMKRVSQKKSTPIPDIFDEISVELEHAKSGALKFLKSFEVIKKRRGIARSYENLTHASAIAECVLRNARNMENCEKISALLKNSLDAIDILNAPAAARLKFMYVFARDEGYPIIEDFFSSLNGEEKQNFAFIIKTAIKQLETFDSVAENYIAPLESWIRINTDILI